MFFCLLLPLLSFSVTLESFHLGLAVLHVQNETFRSRETSCEHGQAGPSRPISNLSLPLPRQSDGQDLDGSRGQRSDRATTRPNLNLTKQALPWNEQVGGQGAAKGVTVEEEVPGGGPPSPSLGSPQPVSPRRAGLQSRLQPSSSSLLSITRPRGSACSWGQRGAHEFELLGCVPWVCVSPCGCARGPLAACLLRVGPLCAPLLCWLCAGGWLLGLCEGWCWAFGAVPGQHPLSKRAWEPQEQQQEVISWGLAL